MKRYLRLTPILGVVAGAALLGCNFPATPSARHEPASYSPTPTQDRRGSQIVADEQMTFGAEIGIARPIAIPPAVIRILMLDERTNRLLQGRNAEGVADAFAASEVDLNSDTVPDIVVQEWITGSLARI